MYLNISGKKTNVHTPLVKISKLLVRQRLDR